MATEIELSTGEHNVLWSLADHADLTAVIDVKDTEVECKTVNGFAAGCYTTLPDPVVEPIVYAPSGSFTVTGYLKESVVTDLDSWVESKGGVAAIEGNKAAVFEIKDGYAGIEDLGFTVTKGDVFTIKDYYAGIT